MISLLLLLLPSQLAFHFWPSWSLVNGIRVDYLSPTFYLTDLIIIGLFISSRLRVRIPLPIIIFVVLNTLNSTLPLLAIFKWLRVLEYFWLFKYLVSQKNRLLKLVLWTWSLAVLWTALLAWWQFFIQSSVGGLWYWLGERPLSVSTPLVAKISLFGHFLMRPYATLPHPNALAGFLLVSGIIIYFLKFKSKKLLSLESCALGIAALTIPLTFSRTVIILEVLILLFWLRPKFLKVVLLVSSIYFLISITGSVVSASDRLFLIHNSLFIIQKSPLFGVGLGAFIPATNNYLYQPVHNIYLLLASELGLPATVIIGYWLMVHGKRLLRTMNHKLITAVAAIAITGAVDHYWFTLHQNTLLLVVLFALIKLQSITTNDKV